MSMTPGITMTPLKATFLTLLLAAAPVDARSGEGQGGDGGGGREVRHGLSNATTNSVVLILTRDGERCNDLPRVYKFDCVSQTYRRAARKLQSNRNYTEAYQALEQVASTLSSAVAANRDTSQKKLRKGLNFYTPVKPAAVPQIKQQGQRAMQKAETILLRSPGEKKVHYARIAEAVNSNKVLLRSALLPGGPLRFALHLLRLAVPV